MLQSPTSRGTYCNHIAESVTVDAKQGFNPLPHGAHIATGDWILRNCALRQELQSPTSRGTYCNLWRGLLRRLPDGASIPYLTGHILQLPGTVSACRCCQGFNPLPHGAHIATWSRHSESISSGSSFNPLPHGAHIATEGIASLRAVPQSPLQSPTSRGTYCNKNLALVSVMWP